MNERLTEFIIAADEVFQYNGNFRMDNRLKGLDAFAIRQLGTIHSYYRQSVL